MSEHESLEQHLIEAWKRAAAKNLEREANSE